MPLPPFVHPKSHQPLTEREEGWYCEETQELFASQQGIPSFISENLRGTMDDERSGFINNLKTWLRHSPRLYVILIYIISPVCFIGCSAQKFLKRFNPDSTVLNIGSGVHRYNDWMVNIDVFPYKEVDVVADAGALPFADGSVDGVICENLLEHVPHPEQVVDEIFRVLKPGGQVFLSMPFVYPFHASPNDFYRWSVSGMRELCKQGEEEVVAPRSGPTSALVAQLVTWFAIVLSFGWAPLYNFWSSVLLLFFFPFKCLDFIIGYFPTAINGPATVYGIFTKR